MWTGRSWPEIHSPHMLLSQAEPLALWIFERGIAHR
jgi:hypothetical protein